MRGPITTVLGQQRHCITYGYMPTSVTTWLGKVMIGAEMLSVMWTVQRDVKMCAFVNLGTLDLIKHTGDFYRAQVSEHWKQYISQTFKYHNFPV